ELKRMDRQRAALAQKDQRLLDAYQAGIVKLEELKARRQRLRLAEQRLEERAQVVRQQGLEVRHAAPVADAVTAFCARGQPQLVGPPFELKQKILRLVVERIVVSDEEIAIEHVIPGEPTSRLHLRPSGVILPCWEGRDGPKRSRARLRGTTDDICAGQGAARTG